MSRTKKQKLPIWRVLLAIVMATAATVLLIYGSVILTAKASISKTMIKRMVNSIDLEKEYGAMATEAVNTGIKRLAGSAYTENMKLTEDELFRHLDMKAIESFIIDKTSEFSSAVTSNHTAKLDSRELVGLFDGVQEYVRQETGMEASDEQIQTEIERAIGLDPEKGQHTYETIPEAHIIHTGRGVVFVVLGALLLLGTYLALWPRFNLGSLLCIISCIILCLALVTIGTAVQKVYDMSEVTAVFGESVILLWTEKTAELFVRRGLFALLGVVLPLGVSLVYYIDYNHVIKLESSHRER